MYVPTAFAWHDQASIVAFCRDHPFATLIAGDPPEAQHLPLLVDANVDHLVLHGHAAVDDPLWRQARALAVFSGPHAFVSAGWYDEAGLVPTWNYLAVHAAGLLTLIDDGARVAALFDRLAAESEGDARRAWQERLPAERATQLAAQVRWFRIDATCVQAKAKLSQNHPPARRERVIARLSSADDAGAHAVAAAMRRTLAGEPPWPMPPS